MAKILDQAEQQRALKNINNSIKEIKGANDFLQAENPSGTYTIAFTAEDGKKHTTEFKAESKDAVHALILAHKAKEKERIQALAQENRIELEDSDKEALDFTL